MRNERSTPQPEVAGSRLSCLCVAILLIILAGRDAPRAGQDVPSLLGATRPAVQVDRALQAAFERTGVAAASVAVVGPGGSLHVRTFGRRFGDAVTPADDRTVFRAASLGKAVFADLVFTLVGSGQLDLDRPLHEYLPKPLTDYPDYADLRGDLRYRTITARLALSHRTGFPNWRWQLDDGKLRILFDPGTKFLYSGEGYRYLQFVVEQITGRTLQALAEERVFRPLGMTDTSYVWKDEFAANCAIDRAPIEKVFGPDFLRRANCAGSLLTTATDYARFLRAVLDGKGLPGRLRDEMLRPQASIAGSALFGPPAATGPAAATGAEPSWCLGWGAFASRAGAARFHVGYDSPEYENYAVLYLDRKIGLVALTSGGRGPNSAVPAFVEAAIGNNDTPFAWAGYGPHPQSRSSAPDPEQPDGLQAWLRSGNVASLSAAIDRDPGVVNRPDADGVQPLAWSAFFGQRGVFDLLLARGADPKALNPLIGTVVHAAVLGGQSEIIRTLAARGVDLEAGGPADLPPLVLAAGRGLASGVAALLAAGASVDSRDSGGNTALLLAASSGDTAVVQALLARRAKVSLVNAQGITPLEAALRQGHGDVAHLLRAAGAAASPLPVFAGPYLGGEPPIERRQLFAPRFVSTERRELNAAFTSDGRTLFFSRNSVGMATQILMTASAGGVWSTPAAAPFSHVDASDVDVFVSPGATDVYFSSDRPRPGQPPASPAADAAASADADIWVAHRQGSAWSEAEWLGPDINAHGADDYYPTLTRSGTLYFSSNRPGGLGQNDIYRVRRVGGRWAAPENLGAPVNTAGREFDPFVSPDETYLVFASERPGGHGSTDLYVSARNADGTWATPVNLGPRVNSKFEDYSPMVSPDGRHLFFTSGTPGSDDVYWIAASVIRQAIAAGRGGL